MISTRAPLPRGPIPPTISRPLLIWRAPRPSDVAEPKSVAKIAKMSISFPKPPPACRPRMGEKAAEISWRRPLR
jgi:hypothetical protein